MLRGQAEPDQLAGLVLVVYGERHDHRRRLENRDGLELEEFKGILVGAHRLSEGVRRGLRGAPEFPGFRPPSVGGPHVGLAGLPLQLDASAAAIAGELFEIQADELYRSGASVYQGTEPRSGVARR